MKGMISAPAKTYAYEDLSQYVGDDGLIKIVEWSLIFNGIDAAEHTITVVAPTDYEYDPYSRQAVIGGVLFKKVISWEIDYYPPQPVWGSTLDEVTLPQKLIARTITLTMQAPPIELG